MFASLCGEFKELNADGYSVIAKCGEKYVMVLNGGEDDRVMGVNEDGSSVLDIPDWVVTDFKISDDEVKDYSGEVLFALYKFGEKLENTK